MAHAPGCALVGVKVLLALQQVGFAQQAAGGGGEAGVEKPARQPCAGAAHHRRGQAVAALYVALGTQILQVNP